MSDVQSVSIRIVCPGCSKITEKEIPHLGSIFLSDIWGTFRCKLCAFPITVKAFVVLPEKEGYTLNDKKKGGNT